MNKRNVERATKRAVKKAGGQSALSRALGVSQPRVNYWVRWKKAIPGEFVLATEAATGVSRHELRPDIYPQEA